MKNYSEAEYLDLFKKFFKTGHLDGTYKCVFLHALTDLSQFGKDDLIGKEWISEKGDTITLDLNFMAVRFAKIYYDIRDSGIKHTSSPRNEPNILDILRDPKISEIPTLSDFASSKMEMNGIRKDIIQDSIKPEVLKNLKVDFPEMYDISEKGIVFKISLIDFVRSHEDYLRFELGKRLKNHLRDKNRDKQIQGFSVDPANPFYQYLADYRLLFLAGVERKESVQRFKKSVEAKIKPKYLDDINTPVSVWGLRSTPDNKEVWNKVRHGDAVLFSKDNQCFAKGVVSKTIRNAKEAKHLWDDKSKSTHNLLIIFESIAAVQIDLANSQVQLTDPAMPDEHNFPLIQVDDERVLNLLSVYDDIDTALDSLSEPIEDIHNVQVSLVEGRAKVRRGQDEFRKRVLENYHAVCAVCDISQEDLLEASHILPVGNTESAGDIKNGVCLCVLHHKMFDEQYMYFDTDYALKFTSKATKHLQKTCTKMKITKSMCLKKPSQSYLKRYYELKISKTKHTGRIQHDTKQSN